MTTTDLPLHMNSPLCTPNQAPYAIEGCVGSPGIPMFAHVATPAHQAEPYDRPQVTTSGVVCGHCTDTWERGPLRHATVADVTRCWDAIQYEEWIHWSELPARRAGAL